MDAPYPSRGCEKCPYTDKSRPYYYGRLLTYYWHIFKISHIPRRPINRKREIIQYVTAFLRCRSQRDRFAKTFAAAKVQKIFEIDKKICNFRADLLKLQCGESVALLHKPLDGLRKDGEHALIGLEGVVEIDDGTGAHLALDLREHILGCSCRVIILREDIPIDNAIAELMQGAALRKRGFAVRRSE